MRTSFRSVGSFVTLASSLVLVSAAFVACGGETASLGSQGAEQGLGGKDGGAGTNGGGSNSSGGSGAGGSDIVGCATIDITCDAGSQYKTYNANGCEYCAACPAIPAFVGDCPNGTRDVRDTTTGCITQTVCKDDVPCPDIAPSHPDFCKGGIVVPTTDAKGCPTNGGCLCPSEPACGPNTKPVPRPNGACGNTCEPSSCPEIVEPGPNQCPSGGFVPKYGADGCINGFDCKSCPLAGDPSFCANGTIRFGIKEGQCDYSKVDCIPCKTGIPASLGWCNDGAVNLKKEDGTCRDLAECQCPSYGQCPPDRVSVAIPGSFCGAFVCNDVSCPKVQDPGDIACDGGFTWERDANDCVSTLVCNAPK